MVRQTVFAAAITAAIAALVLTFLQIVWVAPIIMQAETYAHPEVQGAGLGELAHEHEHSAEEWKPEDGWQRTAFTLAANLLLGFGYALLLIAVYFLWREPRNVVYGVLYGISGFVVFYVAPSLGLPAELPGTAAAEVIVRQSWWAIVAVATAAGLLLLFSRVPLGVRALGVVLIIAPHFIPAPQPEVASSVAPEFLQSQFRVASTVSNAIFWLLLGLVSSVAFRQFLQGRVAAR